MGESKGKGERMVEVSEEQVHFRFGKRVEVSGKEYNLELTNEWKLKEEEGEEIVVRRREMVEAIEREKIHL